MKNQISKIGYAVAVVMAILMTGFSKVTVAQNDLTWDNLGTKVVDYAMDRDVFTASSEQTYTALKIKVNNGAVNIHKVTIHYANGDTQDVKLPNVLTKDNDGKLIDLKGNQRVIDKITFWYDTKNGIKGDMKGNKEKEKAVVEVWAKK